MFRILLGILIVGYLGACSDMSLTPLKESAVTAESLGEFCTKDPDVLNRFTKLLFVMDKSGSNQTGNQQDPTPTDPANVKRAGNFERYYNEKKSNPWLKWGMISFNGATSEAMIRDEAEPNKAIFTQDEALVNAGVERLRGPDSNGTPYDAALSRARIAIRQDIEDHPDEDSIYVVLFITDGVPTSPDISADPAGTKDLLLETVEDLVNLKPGSISLSTAFYGPAMPVGEDLLQEMANTGGGKYTNFNNTDFLDFDELIVQPGKEPWRLKNMIVYNLNSAICESQYYGLDSDGDGVCDEDETKYGLNKQKRYTFNDGYSDYFWWMVKTNQLGAGNLTGCPASKRVDKDFDGMNECEEMVMKNSNPLGTIKRTANPLDPDTDSDGILDGLEAIIFRNMLGAPMNDRDVLTDWDREGLSAYIQIFQHRNPLFGDSNAPRYDTFVDFSGFTGNGQSCYSFKQRNLQLYKTLPVEESGGEEYLKAHRANENHVLVYFIQTRSTDPNGKGILMYDYQTLIADQNYQNGNGAAAGLRIRDYSFDAYVIPKEQ